MTHKDARALLDLHLAGWADLAERHLAIKTAVDPKHRLDCIAAFHFLISNPEPTKRASKKTAKKKEA